MILESGSTGRAAAFGRLSRKRRASCLEDLCFDAQQAAEKAIKATLICRGVSFSYVHDLGELLTLLQRAVQVDPAVMQAVRLTRHAVMGRYPGVAEPVGQEEYATAVTIASIVVSWAEKIVGPGPGSPPQQDQGRP